MDFITALERAEQIGGAAVLVGNNFVFSQHVDNTRYLAFPQVPWGQIRMEESPVLAFFRRVDYQYRIGGEYIGLISDIFTFGEWEYTPHISLVGMEEKEVMREMSRGRSNSQRTLPGGVRYVPIPLEKILSDSPEWGAALRGFPVREVAFSRDDTWTFFRNGLERIAIPTDPEVALPLSYTEGSLLCP